MQVCARSHTCAQSRHLFEVGKVDGGHPPSPGEQEGRRLSRGERGRRRLQRKRGGSPVGEREGGTGAPISDPCTTRAPEERTPGLSHGAHTHASGSPPPRASHTSLGPSTAAPKTQQARHATVEREF